MNKKGFTLIELMVVVVIIGILAAVAVPKLFGMIAKSKASEVGPAAGTYVKMQQAYISESSKMGNWTIIGYKGPGTSVGDDSSSTTNFGYKDKHTGYDATDNNANLTSDGAVGWSANNKTKLNDCETSTGDANWTITVGGTADDGGDAAFVAGVKSANCLVLTPTFKSISIGALGAAGGDTGDDEP